MSCCKRQPFDLTAINAGNQSVIKLTDRIPFFICEYEGLNPMPSILATQSIYGRDGVSVVGSKADVRNVVLTISIFRDVPQIRKELYEVFKIGSEIEFEFENSNGKRYFSGICESIEFSQFGSPDGAVKQSVQISIYCLDPWLYGDDVTLNFPDATNMTLNYDGDGTTGFRLVWVDPEEPDFYSVPNLDLWSRTTDESLNVTPDDEQVQPGGTIYVIDTAQKTAETSTGLNLVNWWEHGSRWLVLVPGENRLVFAAGEAATLSYRPKYQGV